MKQSSPYNPLATENLAESISLTLLRQPAIPLGQVEKFGGAGIYLLYYNGNFPPYKAIAAENRNGKFKLPIYVGKAAQSGSRKGGLLEGSTTESKIHQRLLKHKTSVVQATNLELDDFYCRILVIEGVFIPLAEQLAISNYAPIWNQIIDGFGNNPVGKGRKDQVKSRWDTLHPGRKKFEHLKKRPETQQQIEQEIMAILASR